MKPVIRMRGGQYYCSASYDDARESCGISPMAAYDAWRRA